MSPGIRDFMGGVCSDLNLKVVQGNPQPLTSEEIAELQNIGQAAANTFLPAQMGLEILADHIHAMVEHGETGRENEASALLNLLSELIFYSHEVELTAECTLRTHYQNLIERAPVESSGASKAKPRKRGAK